MLMPLTSQMVHEISAGVGSWVPSRPGRGTSDTREQGHVQWCLTPWKCKCMMVWPSQCGQCTDGAGARTRCGAGELGQGFPPLQHTPSTALAVIPLAKAKHGPFPIMFYFPLGGGPEDVLSFIFQQPRQVYQPLKDSSCRSPRRASA